MRILALGDVVGRPGRQALKKHVSCLRRELALDFVFANGENAAGGIGLTHDTLDEILSCGVDVVTGSTGNFTLVWTLMYAFCVRPITRMRRAGAMPFIPLATVAKSRCATCRG